MIVRPRASRAYAPKTFFRCYSRHSAPYKFYGFGGFIDVLVDRGYGHGYDANDPSTVALLRCFADLNEIMLDAGMIKPTVMTAYFTKDNRGEIYYRERRATGCLRDANFDPSWARFYSDTPTGEKLRLQRCEPLIVSLETPMFN